MFCFPNGRRPKKNVDKADLLEAKIREAWEESDLALLQAIEESPDIDFSIWTPNEDLRNHAFRYRCAMVTRIARRDGWLWPWGSQDPITHVWMPKSPGETQACCSQVRVMRRWDLKNHCCEVVHISNMYNVMQSVLEELVNWYEGRAKELKKADPVEEVISGMSPTMEDVIAQAQRKLKGGLF